MRSGPFSPLWRALGSGTVAYVFPVVLLTTWSPLTSISSPSLASKSGAVIRLRPRLIEFWRKMRAKSLATIVSC
jgi:hypothetical protein